MNDRLPPFTRDFTRYSWHSAKTQFRTCYCCPTYTHQEAPDLLVYRYVVADKFGVAPCIGFEVGHFRMGLEYNLITGQPKDFNRNYFSAKIGAFLVEEEGNSIFRF